MPKMDNIPKIGSINTSHDKNTASAKHDSFFTKLKKTYGKYFTFKNGLYSLAVLITSSGVCF
jgi:hypothetical protein